MAADKDIQYKSKPATKPFEPQTQSPMQAEMRGLSLRDIANYWRSLFKRKSRTRS